MDNKTLLYMTTESAHPGNTTDRNITGTGNMTLASEIGDDLSFDLEKIGRLIYIVTTGTIVPLGTIGNILSFIVLVTMAKKSSFYTYLVALSLVDVGIVFAAPFIRLTNILSGIPLHEIFENYLCSVEAFVMNTMTQISSWLTMVIAFDRYIAVCHPLKASSYCTMKRACVVTLLITLLHAGLNVPSTCFSRNPRNCDNNWCYSEVAEWISVVGYILIPAPVIVVMNAIIAFRVIGASKFRMEVTSTNPKVYRTIAILFVVSAVFLLLSAPMMTQMVLWQLNVQSTTNPEVTFYMNIALETCTNLNHSVNFILYCVSGQAFREKLGTIFCRRNN